MNEHFYMEIYLADTPLRRNAQHFGGGSEQLAKLYNRTKESKKSTTKCIKYVLTKSSRIMV